MEKRQMDVEGLACTVSDVRSNAVCYILLPMQLEADTVDAWAERFGVNIVTVSGMRWNDDTTPWAAKALSKRDDDFGGKGAEFLKTLTTTVMPAVESSLRCKCIAHRMLLGVSLSGLFAVWAATISSVFSAVASVSGSFWYDGFADWFDTAKLSSTLRFAYVSIGDKESHSRNPRFATVGTNTERIVATLRRTVPNTVFEQTSGTHFSPPEPRIEKALCQWTKLHTIS